MASIDYTPVLLAQITDLQQRLTKQEALVGALKAEVERLSGQALGVTATAPSGGTMRHSVPLRSTASEFRPTSGAVGATITQERKFDGSGFRSSRGQAAAGSASRVARGPPVNAETRPERQQEQQRRSRPRVAPPSDKASTGEKAAHPTMTLADVLEKDEVVTMRVRLPRREGEEEAETTVVATFDGTDLAVTECELVESLVGTKSAKPGEILYKFIDELKTGGHIKRTFTIAPWRLCFVTRDGEEKTLEALRSTKAPA
jgi:hypothetical protein